MFSPSHVNGIPFIKSLLLSAALVVLLGQFSPGMASEPPAIPIGDDAYLRWDLWPQQRIGLRAYMRSTYDRREGNEGADASHFLYQLADDHSVVLDVAGAGILYFARHNHWHGSPWRYEVDGTEHLVKESSTATRDTSLKNSIFLPREQFPAPLAVTWGVTKGADLSWVPVAFEKSFRLGYSWTHYGTGYFIYHQWIPGLKLSRPLQAWDGKKQPDPAVLELFNRAGTDLLPASSSAAAKSLGLTARSGKLALAKNQTATVLFSQQAPASIRALDFSVPREQAIAFGRARLRITWDERTDASVDAPVALFFGAGTLYNRDNREYLVKALPVSIRYDAERAHLACYFPMPFFKAVRIELIGNGESEISDIAWSVRQAPLQDAPEAQGYFHATYRDHGAGELGKSATLLDTRGIEGSEDWSGSFIGTSFIFSDRSELTTLEGDPRFFFDDSETPQAYGTGTEEWGGGGDYWGGVNMTLPLVGHPTGARNAREAKNAEDHIQSAYRFLLADLMPFGKNARITLERGGENESAEHYRTVAYWYGRPGATLKKTDSLQLGDAASEASHRYTSPDASAPYQITSRYEHGPDTHSVTLPKSQPPDFAEFEFEAEAGRPYTIWLRGRANNPAKGGDLIWLQFDDEIGTTRTRDLDLKPDFLGYWSRKADGSYVWGSGASPEWPKTVTFTTSGKHKLRVQPCRPGFRLDAIWLSQRLKTGLSPRPGPDQKADDGIILTAAKAVSLRGEVTVVDDPQSHSGKALLFLGEGTPTTRVVVYPPHTDTGRKTAGTSEFTLTIDPQNLGVMLRRKLDYAFPNQRAEVFIADAKNLNALEWQPAGTWYLAGSNTCVYSNPKEELGATVHTVQTANRRFRDDEFLLPRDLTAGRSAIRVRVKFTPTNIPLFPGHPLAEQKWSEIRYEAWSYLLPGKH